MFKRILSTLALWTLVILCVRFFGTAGGIWLLTIISALTLREFYFLVEKMGVHPFKRVGIALGIAITLAPYYFEPYVPLRAEWLLALAVIVFSIRILGERDPQNRVETLGWSLFGVIYVPFMLHFLARILLVRTPCPNTGLALAIWLIAVSKFCDTGALVTGLIGGKHKMAPNISPKKSWEGVVGGLATSALVGAGLAWAGKAYLPSTFTPWLAAALALPIAALAIVSDLIESVIKRRADIKDTGYAIPGIGGVFDLSDSLILTAPIGWAMFQLL
ncbi:MAG: phosphatidate cytidylyltransferase [Opitutaceae bacterium]|jgi:phosphatidate cytidylyltransferase